MSRPPNAASVGPAVVSRWAWAGNPRLFDIMDADGDGKITREHLLRCLGPNVLEASLCDLSALTPEQHVAAYQAGRRDGQRVMEAINVLCRKLVKLGDGKMPAWFTGVAPLIQPRKDGRFGSAIRIGYAPGALTPEVILEHLSTNPEVAQLMPNGGAPRWMGFPVLWVERARVEGGAADADAGEPFAFKPGKSGAAREVLTNQIHARWPVRATVIGYDNVRMGWENGRNTMTVIGPPRGPDPLTLRKAVRSDPRTESTEIIRFAGPDDETALKIAFRPDARFDQDASPWDLSAFGPGLGEASGPQPDQRLNLGGEPSPNVAATWRYDRFYGVNEPGRLLRFDRTVFDAVPDVEVAQRDLDFQRVEANKRPRERVLVERTPSDDPLTHVSVWDTISQNGIPKPGSGSMGRKETGDVEDVPVIGLSKGPEEWKRTRAVIRGAIRGTPFEGLLLKRENDPEIDMTPPIRLPPTPRTEPFALTPEASGPTRRVYVIKPGDLENVMALAARAGVSLLSAASELMAVNPGKSPSNVKPGDAINIPDSWPERPGMYQLAAGEAGAPTGAGFQLSPSSDDAPSFGDPGRIAQAPSAPPPAAPKLSWLEQERQRQRALLKDTWFGRALGLDASGPSGATSPSIKGARKGKDTGSVPGPMFPTVARRPGSTEAGDAEPQTTRYVSRPAMLREAPGSKMRGITELAAGKPVRIIECTSDNAWCRVDPNMGGVQGWIPTSVLSALNVAGGEAGDAPSWLDRLTSKTRVVTSLASVYAAPGDKLVDKIRPGTSVEDYGSARGALGDPSGVMVWANVGYNGRNGWIDRSLLGDTSGVDAAGGLSGHRVYVVQKGDDGREFAMAAGVPYGRAMLELELANPDLVSRGGGRVGNVINIPDSWPDRPDLYQTRSGSDAGAPVDTSGGGGHGGGGGGHGGGGHHGGGGRWHGGWGGGWWGGYGPWDWDGPWYDADDTDGTDTGRGGGGRGGGRGGRGRGGRGWGGWGWGGGWWGGYGPWWWYYDYPPAYVLDDEVYDSDDGYDSSGPSASRRKLPAAATAHKGPILPWQGSKQAFAELDTNGDGMVDHKELQDGLGHTGVKLARFDLPAHPPLPAGAGYTWTSGTRYVVFPNREAKARYMQQAAEQDSRDPQIIEWAKQFTGIEDPRERAQAILRFAQLGIRYEHDPAWFGPNGERHGIELLDSASVGLARGYGDCDLKARLFVAVALAAGLEARISPVFTGSNGFPHVRAEVHFEDETSGHRPWTIADPTIVNSDLGRLPMKPKVYVKKDSDVGLAPGEPAKAA